jgi:hypothetical protein
MMERPTIRPATGAAQWRANGARQRFAKRLSEEVGVPRVIAAAEFIMRDQKERRGEIGPDDGMQVKAIKEIADWISWLDLRQLKRLRKLAESLDVDEVSVN